MRVSTKSLFTFRVLKHQKGIKLIITNRKSRSNRNVAHKYFWGPLRHSPMFLLKSVKD